MSETSLYLYQKLLKKNKIEESELTDPIKTKIEKFNAEKKRIEDTGVAPTKDDEALLDSLDEKLFSDIDDFIEEKYKAMKEEEKKKKAAALKKEKIDVSTAPTAAKDGGIVPAAGKDASKKGGSFLHRALGRKEQEAAAAKE